MITSYMFHYIRKNPNKYTRYLEEEKFTSKLNFLKDKVSIPYAKKDFDKKFYWLTFDDALKEHFHISNLLNEKNIKATFFIPSMPYLRGEICLVHKAHILVERMGEKTFDHIKDYLGEKTFKSLCREIPEHYKNSDHNNKIKLFKNFVNYSKDNWDKNEVLDRLIERSGGCVKWNDFYLSENEIKIMHNNGMEIGSHSHSHTLLSNLSKEDQEDEIRISTEFLKNLCGYKPSKFCYPYGRPESYNNETINCLKKERYQMAVSIENKDIKLSDMINRPYELPRFDCKEFF